MGKYLLNISLYVTCRIKILLWNVLYFFLMWKHNLYVLNGFTLTGRICGISEECGSPSLFFWKETVEQVRMKMSGIDSVWYILNVF